MGKREAILIFGILLVALGLYFFMGLRPMGKGGVAVVLVDGKEVKSLSLTEDVQYTIETEKGTNVVAIKDGLADMIEATCPDKLCVHQKSVDKRGETIVCLPHKVVIEIQAGQENEVDAVVQ